MPSELQIDPRSILVIHFGQLGDVIMGLPALAAVALRFPGAKKSVAVGSASAEIVRMTGLFDEVIELDRVRLLRSNKAWASVLILRFARDIRRRRFDLVIDLHSLPETNLLGYVSGARYRLFANRESRSIDRLSNVRPAPPKEDKVIHLSENYLRVLEPLGISESRPEVSLTPNEADKVLIDGQLRDHGVTDETLIGLNIGAGHANRRWGIPNFRQLARRIATNEVRPIVILGPEERPLYDEVVDTFPSEAVVFHSLTLPQLAALFTRLSALVSSDTGPMHLAAVMGTPIALLLHRQCPSRYLPLTDKFIAVKYAEIAQVAVEEVEQAVQEVLDDHGSADEHSEEEK